MNILQTKGLSKIYQNRIALSSINLTLEKGKVYGLLGPNGSGKTTLMKIIANLMQPTSGEILIDGLIPSVKTRTFVAYMPTYNHIYKSMNLKEVGEFFKDFFTDFSMEDYTRLLKEMDLEQNLKVAALSSGMASKLRVAITMSRDAKILMLDEPLNGIDLLTRDIIIKTIVDNSKEHSTLIISSHMVEQLEPILDDSILLDRGKIVYMGNLEALREQENISIAHKYREVFSS